MATRLNRNSVLDDDLNIYSLDKRLALMEQNHLTMEKNLERINASLSRLVWAVISAVALAVVQFVLKGGLLGA